MSIPGTIMRFRWGAALFAAVAVVASSEAMATTDFTPPGVTVNPAFGMWGGPFEFVADLYGSNFVVSGTLPYPQVNFGVTVPSNPSWGSPPPPQTYNPPPSDPPPPITPPDTGAPSGPPDNTGPSGPPDIGPPTPPPDDNTSYVDPPPDNPPPNGQLPDNPPCDPPPPQGPQPVAPLPEPAIWMSMIFGFGLLGIVRRRSIEPAFKIS